MTSPALAHALELHADATVIDLHAHPSMKTYLGAAKLTKGQKAKKGFNLTRLRNSYPSLVDGGVDVLCSSVVHLERDLRDDCLLIAIGSLFLSKVRRALSGRPDVIALEMLQHVENEVAEVNAASPTKPMVVVKSYRELHQALQQKKLAVVHMLEGAHVLNGEVANLARFKVQGVASITLAHFYENGVAPPVDGVPDDVLVKRLGCFGRKEDPTLGLSLPLGPQVVEEMFSLGMIVDLTHATPQARRDVLCLPNRMHRPIVMTHVGVTTLRDDPMNPTLDEVRKIAETGGVIGVVFYNYWLTPDEYKRNNTDNLSYVVETVKELVRIGGEDCVAFGSDWDGMTDPPDDLKEPADFPNLTAALVQAGFTDAQIKKFLGGNFLRVLRDGWS